METQTKATNIKLTPDVSDYLDKRLKALEKLIDPDDTSASCKTLLEKTTEHHKQGDIYRAEFNVHIAGHTFRAESHAERLFDAIDETKEQMVKELRRHKSKRLKSRRRGATEIKKIVRGIKG